METAHFKLQTLEEVELFCHRLEQYQLSKGNGSLPYLDLISAYKNLEDFPDAGKLFAALLDLKMNLVMLHQDLMLAGGRMNQIFSKETSNGLTPLEDQNNFNAKADIHHHFTNFVPKYRAFWEKIMGVLLLMYKPSSYEQWSQAKSRKKAFRTICIEIPQIPPDFVESILSDIGNFVETFRTPEVHGTGTLRKWSFSTALFHETPTAQLIGYWNMLLPILTSLDKILRNEDPSIEEEKS